MNAKFSLVTFILLHICSIIAFQSIAMGYHRSRWAYCSQHSKSTYSLILEEFLTRGFRCNMYHERRSRYNIADISDTIRQEHSTRYSYQTQLSVHANKELDIGDNDGKAGFCSL